MTSSGWEAVLVLRMFRHVKSFDPQNSLGEVWVYLYTLWKNDSEKLSNLCNVTQLVGSIGESKTQEKSLTFSDWLTLPFVSSCPSENQVLAEHCKSSGRMCKIPCVPPWPGRKHSCMLTLVLTSLNHPNILTQELLWLSLWEKGTDLPRVLQLVVVGMSGPNIRLRDTTFYGECCLQNRNFHVQVFRLSAWEVLQCLQDSSNSRIT